MRTHDRGSLRLLNDVETAAVRLVCLPHSGGSAATFRAWSAAVPAHTQLIAAQYPGHADRIAEAPAGSVEELAGLIAEDLLRLDPATPCALFGHSLGALVAYETARVMQERGAGPRWLFVSGAPAPELAGGGTTHRSDDEDLWQSLRELGGIEPAVAENDELRELLLPVLRSDIALSETYRPAPGRAPLECRVRGYRTTGDPLVDAAGLDAWASVCAGPFSTRQWPGGHFWFVEDPAELVGDIAAVLTGSEVLR